MPKAMQFDNLKNLSKQTSAETDIIKANVDRVAVPLQVGVLWCGLVYGMECGMVWKVYFGMVWCGIVWNDNIMLWCGMICYVLIGCDMICYDML